MRPDSEARGLVKPPRWLRNLLGRMLPVSDRAHLLEDLDELYALRCERRGAGLAGWWYAVQVVAFATRLGSSAADRGMNAMFRTVIRPGSGLRLTARRLRRRPAQTLAAILTLGVGVGGVATVYATANWVLLRPVPGVRDPDRMVTLQLESNTYGNGISWPISQPDLETLEERLAPLTSLAASSPAHIDVDVGGGPIRESAELVTPDYFEVLGVRATVGRVFRATDHTGNAGPREAIVSYRSWKQLMGGRSDVVGSDIRLNGHPYTVIGVAPRGFHGAELARDTDVWVTTSGFTDIDSGADLADLGLRHVEVWENLVGRLVSGAATVSAVEADANRTMEAIRQDYKSHSFLAQHFVFGAYEGVGLAPALRGSVLRSIRPLAGAAILLLLLAVANVANLGLVRAASRRSESAISLALGAGRFRVAMDSFAESLLIASGGGATALLMTLGAARVFAGSTLSDQGRSFASLEGMTLDWSVVLLAGAVAVCTGMLAGLAPAMETSRSMSLGELSGHRHGSRGGLRFRKVMVVFQVALSTVLVVGAGLLARTVANLHDIDVGFRPDQLVLFSIEPGLHGVRETEMTGLVDRIRRRLAAEPGVAAVAATRPALLQGNGWTAAVQPEGAEDADDKSVISIGFTVSPDMLATLGVELLAGRDFSAGEAMDTQDRGIIISETVARQLFPGVDPRTVVGRLLSVPRRKEAPLRVIGVAHDARLWQIEVDEGMPFTFRAWSSNWTSDGEAMIGVRVTRPAVEMFDRIRAAVRDVDPSFPVYDMRSARQQVDVLLAPHLTLARLALSLAVLGLLLAAIGLYGVLGYSVTERMRELGIRTALGARPMTLQGSVLLAGLSLTGVGVAIGSVGAAWAGRIIEHQLYRMTPFDPVNYGAGLALIIAVACLASWWPARRAMSASPIEILRAD